MEGFLVPTTTGGALSNSEKAFVMTNWTAFKIPDDTAPQNEEAVPYP